MKPAFQTFTNQRSGREGFALILVLGILVVLSLLAITFSSIVQSDRRAAVMQFEKTKANMLVDSAVGQVIERLEAVAYNAADPLQAYPAMGLRTAVTSQGGTAMLPQEVNRLLSIVNTSIADIDNSYPGSTEIARYLRLTPDTANLPGSAGWVDPQWVPLTNRITGAVIGEFAFVAANFSGLYDASANAIPRQNGTSGVEIASPFPGSGANNWEWIASTTKYSNNKLGVLNRTTPWQTVNGNLAALVDPNNPYVLYPISIGVNNLSTAISDPAFAAVLEQLPAPGTRPLNALQITRLQSAFADFVDADDIPTLPYTHNAHATTEANPMFNEFIVEVTGGGGSDVNVKVDAEIAFPFLTPPAGAFTRQIGGTLRISDASGWSQTAPVTVASAAQAVNAGNPASRYQIVNCLSRNFTYTGSASSFDVRLTLDNNARISTTGGGATVVDGFIGGNIVFNFTNMSGIRSYEAIDPRINGLLADWQPTGSATPAARTSTSITLPTGLLAFDQTDDMFVRNGPFLTTGELGYLCYDKWATLSLYPRQDGGGMTVYHRVYDFFTASNAASTSPQFVRRHLMNPNSVDVYNDTSPRLLLSYVFEDAPIEKAPGLGPVGAISAADANSIAAAIFAQGMGAGTPYLSNSEVLQRLPTAQLPHNIVGAAGEFEAESVYRNTMDLFNCRQNYFGIVLTVRTDKSLVAAEQIFIEVYRDAFPVPATGRHPHVITRQIRPSMF